MHGECNDGLVVVLVMATRGEGNNGQIAKLAMATIAGAHGKCEDGQFSGKYNDG